jgi:biopolymer transport protein ExbB
VDVRETIAAGGPILLLLIALSVFSIALIGAKFLQMRPALGSARAREEALALWRAGNRDGALAAIAAGSGPPDRLLGEAMRGLLSGRPRVDIEAELQWRGNAEMGVLQRHLRLLDLIAMVSPLLGLLGTVTGMIQAFQDLSAAGGAANAAILAGGIWEALLTTAAGLVVAIPAAVAAGLMADRADRAAEVAEAAVGRLFLIGDGR